MKVVDRKTVTHNMGDTRTVQHFNTLLGEAYHYNVKLTLKRECQKNYCLEQSAAESR